MNVYDKYQNVFMAECVSPIENMEDIRVGESYRVGVRYNALMKKEVYYLIDIKGLLGMTPYVEIESEYFKPHELSSISFILA